MIDKKFILTSALIIFFAGLVVGYQYVTKIAGRNDRVPMKHGPLKYDLKFIDCFGKKGRLADMKGKVWVFNQIFTHCPTVCRPMTLHMHKLQEKLIDKKNDFSLVTITFDPKNDTPEVLKKYAEENGVRFDKSGVNNWLWITGKNPVIIREFLKKTFYFGSKQNDDEVAKTEGDFTHTNFVALIDKKLGFRDTYNIERIINGDLERDIRSLLAEKD